MKLFSSKKRAITTLIGVSFGLFFLWLAIQDVDVATVSNTFKQIQAWYTAPLILMIVIFYWLKARRWADLLSPILRLSGQQVMPTLMIGFAANNILPAHAGELIRVYLLGKQFQLSNSSILATVILERILDIVAVLFWIAVALLFGADSQNSLLYAGYLVFGITLVTLFLIYSFSRWTNYCLSFINNFVLWMVPAKFRTKIHDQLALAAEGLHTIRQPALFLRILINSIAQWMVMAMCFYFAIIAMQITAPPVASFVILGLVVFGLTLPSAPGFFGTIELCFVLGLKPYGIDPGAAFSAGIFYHILIYILVTGSGFFYLGRLETKIGDIRDAAEK